MDLTPPSLTGSPYSPGNKHLDSPPPYHTYNYMSRAPDGSYAHLPSLESSCDTPSSYTIIDPGLADAFDIGSPFAPSESIPPSIEWPAVPSTTSPPSSTTSSMLPRPSDYGQFGYESSGISNSPYQAASTYSRTASLSPAYMATPPMPASDGAERFPHMFSSRPPLASSPALGGASSSPYGNVANSSGFVSSSLMPPSSLHMATTSHPGPQMLLPEALQPHQVPIHPHVQPGTHIRGFNTSASPVPPAAGPPPRLVPSSDLARSHNANQSWDTSKKDKGRHPRRHTTKEEANYQCNVKGCGKFFSRNYNYKSHMETHDEKREYPFPCQEPDCTKKFVRRTDLQRHHQSVHAKERAHKCDYCGRTFARKDTRRRFVMGQQPTHPPGLLGHHPPFAWYDPRS